MVYNVDHAKNVRRRVNSKTGKTPTTDRTKQSERNENFNVVNDEKYKKKIEEVPSKVKAWISASRPHTLTASVAPVIVGYALTLKFSEAHDDNVGNEMSLGVIAFGFASFANLIQLGTNTHNDYADFVKGTDTYERVGHARATQKGWLSPFETACGTSIILFLASLIGIHHAKEANVKPLNGGGFDYAWTFVVISSVFNAVAYTGGPFPLGYIGLGNVSIGYSGLGDLFVLLYFGFVATLGVPYLYLRIIYQDASPISQLFLENDLMQRALTLGIPIGFLATAIIVVNNLRDRHTDIHTRKMTLAVRFGGKFARNEYAFLVIFSYVILIPMAMKYGLYYLLPMLTIPLAILEMKAVAFNGKDGSALNTHVGGTAKLQFLFCILLAIGIKLS